MTKQQAEQIKMMMQHSGWAVFVEVLEIKQKELSRGICTTKSDVYDYALNQGVYKERQRIIELENDVSAIIERPERNTDSQVTY